MNIKFLLLALVISGFLATEPVFAQAPLQYTLLEPIGGLQKASTDGNLSGLIGAVFRILFSLIALWAVGLFVAGGIMYMTTEIAGTFDKAKKMLWSALYALLILAGSYLLLSTINPDILSFKLDANRISSGPTNSNTIPAQFAPQPHNTGVVTRGSIIRVEDNSSTREQEMSDFSDKCEKVGGRATLKNPANQPYTLIECR